MVRVMHIRSSNLIEIGKKVASIEGFPRVISRVNRIKADVVSITISGDDEDVEEFLEELSLIGIEQ